MKKFRVTVKGIVPLLQARHLTPEEEKEVTKLSGGKRKARDLTDKEQFEMHAYKTKDGKFYQPSEMFEAAMVKAAVNFKLEGKKSYKDLFNGGVILDSIEIVHKNQDFEMDSRWGKNPNTRGAVWVVRPRIDNWELEFVINLLQDERISGEILKEIISYSGLYVGVGSWRPKFGRFEVVKFEEIR